MGQPVLFHKKRGSAKLIRRRLVAGVIVVGLLALIAAGVIAGLYRLGVLTPRWYTAEHFGITTLKSPLDQNGDGVDDYTAILLGARTYVGTQPYYTSAYYKGGYPPAGEGVCTDVVWNAFLNAGYVLRDMVDEDIVGDGRLEERDRRYRQLGGDPDSAIDFRRVRNLKVFFDRYATMLTTDTAAIADWQPGDIVVFSGHIAIISDRRNKKGVPWIIHHGSNNGRYEEDALARYEILGHYRWDGWTGTEPG